MFLDIISATSLAAPKFNHKSFKCVAPFIILVAKGTVSFTIIMAKFLTTEKTELIADNVVDVIDFRQSNVFFE